MVTVALAVIEEGHATYTVGELTPAQLMHHFSKIDLAIGVHLRESEMLRTGTLLEQMEKSGIEIYKHDKYDYSIRYYAPQLELRFTSKEESVVETLRKYIKEQGFTIGKANEPLHVRHLERMRHRTGYIVKDGE
jgi:hypothetical protein